MVPELAFILCLFQALQNGSTPQAAQHISSGCFSEIDVILDNLQLIRQSDFFFIIGCKDTIKIGFSFGEKSNLGICMRKNNTDDR